LKKGDFDEEIPVGDGTVQYFLEDFIEIGVDIINPVQVSAKGMNPKMLKEKYGDRVNFWGGVDTQHILPNEKRWFKNSPFLLKSG